MQFENSFWELKTKAKYKYYERTSASFFVNNQTQAKTKTILPKTFSYSFILELGMGKIYQMDDKHKWQYHMNG